MSKVLITGGAGFLGSHLCDRLAQDGHEVCPVDNSLGGEWTNIEDARTRQRACGVDCTEFAHIASVMKWFKPDLVYIAAAAPHEGLSVFSPAFVSKQTFLSAVATASAACAAGVKRVVFLSSMARYGKSRYVDKDWGSTFQPFHEEMEPSPVDPYGIAKVAAEQTLKVLCQEHGVELVVAVPHSVVGPRQRYWDPYRNVASIMANLMLQGRQPFIYGDGTQMRCFTFIQDAIEPLVKCGFQDGLDGEVINIGPDEEFITINELSQRLHDITKGPTGDQFRPVYLPDRPREVKVAYCDSAKSRRLLGYKTTVSLDQGLRELVELIRKRGPREFLYHIPIEVPNSPRIPRTWKERLM